MDSQYHTQLQETLSHEAIAKALFENYESLYAVDIETSAYQCFHESDSFSALNLESRGSDFFADAENNMLKMIYPEDRDYARSRLSREALLAGVEAERYYAVVYRLMIDGAPLYHKLRATRETVNGRAHILIGVRNIDKTFRRDQKQAEQLSAMHRKEINHLEAVLASAEGYMEVNLTRDTITELSSRVVPEDISERLRRPESDGAISYSAFQRWRIENLIVENAGQYARISSSAFLIGCFERGDRRASVSFSMKTPSGQTQPCRKVFYLYQDESSGDVLAFCVLYDLTEQQRREKELRDLERQLQLSRIRNFTSQMQPHFLYNALGSIQEIVLEDPQYASDLIGDFTVHLRSCIRAMSSDAPIPFEQEMANVRAYVNIERMRFGDKLSVVYDIRTEDFAILPLSVQPIVENAIRHGIYQRGPRGGTVEIHTRERADAWVVTVRDDGVGFDVDEYRKGLSSAGRDSTGIQNILFRLDKVMGASMQIDSAPSRGTTVTITIPKEAEKP